MNLDGIFGILSATQDLLGRDAVYRFGATGETRSLRVAPERFWDGALDCVYPVAVDRALWSFRADALGVTFPNVGDELEISFGAETETFVVVLNRDDDRCWTWRDKAARARIIVCVRPKNREEAKR